MAIGLSGFSRDDREDPGTARGAAWRSADADVAQYTGDQAGDGAEPPVRRAFSVPQAVTAAPAQPDSRLLKKSLSQLEPKSGKAMAYFFALLFLRHPQLRAMFPAELAAHGQRLFAALTRYAWECNRPESLTGWLCELAREHRKFGVEESHFRPFCDALQAALAAYSEGHTAEQAGAAWRAALEHMAVIMAGALRDARDEPAWWVAEVVEHELRCPDLAVLTLRPGQPLPYLAGQHVSVQVPRWPRVWREYSLASAPDGSGLLRLHVRAVPCGQVSTALVHHTSPGDTLILGPARGTMTASAVTGAAAVRPGGGGIVLLAGGTGLAPLKAIVEELTAPGGTWRGAAITLFAGARDKAGLYDLASLRRLARDRPRLTVTPVVSGDPSYPGLRGTLAEVAAGLPAGTGDVFVCGPPGMVSATVRAAAAAAPGARIHADPLPGPTRLPAPAGPPRPVPPASRPPWEPPGPL